MADGVRLQAVQLVQRAVDRRVGDEVVDVRVVVAGGAGGFVDEGAGAREGVVRSADGLGVGERLAAQVRREPRREVLERAQLAADVDGRRVAGGRVLVEDHREDGLRAAGVLDRLGREEEVCAGVGVVRAVLRGCARGRRVAQVFEEEDDAVDRAGGC